MMKIRVPSGRRMASPSPVPGGIVRKFRLKATCAPNATEQP
jgi:hypothetical protein